MKTGLVLEGGAMRGMFTAGVLDAMMNNNITVDGTIGVSAGATFGCNFKSKQIGRTIRYNMKYSKDPRYVGIRSLIKTGDLYGADFCYREIPEKLDVFDTKTYQENPMAFYVVATDVNTGKPVYHLCPTGEADDIEWYRASASMPLVSRIVKINGLELLDGGISDSIPIKKFREMGYEKNILILTQHDGYRKIITTPEGFDKKVLPAMHELEIPVYKDYFLLFDECEKAIQDVGYRGDIYLPVEDFFKFENKAMVSATPIVPSDPRFEENGFKILKLVPTYDSRIELTLCTTNNTVAVMRKLLKRLENETVCVFLNSTETILSLIYALRLQGRSRVFCSEKSVRKLKQMNFTDASETLDELAPVNFLTSRFYAAVDIKLDYKPHVILLTDVMRAPFSAVDPQTEVVQAIGRFRNGVARAYHIANTSDNLQCLTREALERRLTGEENIYNQIRQIQPDGEDEAQARFQALNGMAYKRFVTRDGNRNHFMWDNAWTDEQIKAYYRYPSTLTAAYKSAPFRLTVCTAHYPITDADRLRREKAKMNTRELWREVVGQLAKLQTAHSDMEPAFLQEELGNEFAAIVQAFTILGAKRMEELGYSRSKIEAAMTRTEENVLLTAPKMQEAVYAQYKTGDLVACSEINNFLHRLIVNNGIPFEGRRVDRKVVKLFFEIEDDTKRLGGQKAFLLGKKMFEF